MAQDNQDTFSDSASGSEEIEASPKNINAGKKIGKISDYEKLRLKTIEENQKRMEALGIKKMANSFSSSVPKRVKKRGDKKGKAKVVDEEEEYKPSDEEEDSEFSSEEDGEPDDSYAEFQDSSIKINMKKAKNNVKTSKKQKSSEKPKWDSDYVDDDEEMMQAIALSLKDNAGFIDVKKSVSQSTTVQMDSVQKERNTDSQTPKRKRKKVMSSRIQIKEDELIMHFFQFDEMGKGSITLRDIQRIAAAHDFMWSDKEIADMIRYFDSDGDGKLNLDDFGKIADRCNMMIQHSSEVALT